MFGLRLLVAGGAGFIGSNFVRLVAAETDWEVLVLDALTYAGRPENLEGVLDGRCRLVVGDICDRELVEDVFGSFRPDAVVNLAAESHVDRSIWDGAPFLRTNVLGVGVLLEASRRAEVRAFLQVSTDEVYGSLPLEGQEEFTEQCPLRPSSPYSASKAAADLLCRAYWVTHGVPVVVTRCCNNFGPYQYPEKLVPVAVCCALEGRPVPVYGDGRNVREWIYVEDHCRALLAALVRGKPGEVYNIGTGVRLPNLEMVGRVLRLLGMPEDFVEFVADRPGHDARYAVSAEKAARELGWRPWFGFDEALALTVRWYVENREWWELR